MALNSGSKSSPKATPACSPTEVMGSRCLPSTDWYCPADELAQFHVEQGGLDLKAGCLKRVGVLGERQSQLVQALFMALSGVGEREQDN